jgi:hypothetical protein
LKKLLIILLFPAFAFAQPKIHLVPTSQVTYSNRDTLLSSACDPNCGLITYNSYTQVSGPAAAIAWGPNTPTQAIAYNLKPGLYIFRVNITNASGQSGSDTTLFVVMNPLPQKVDTAGIQALKICQVCQAPIICPPIPKQRTTVDVTWDIINNKKLITYDDGTTSSL